MQGSLSGPSLDESRYDADMRELAILLIHFVATLAKLLGPGGARAVAVESLLLKQQLIVFNRARKRAPNLSATDRVIMALCAGFMRPGRLLKSAIVLKPSTILGFHRALVKRKYRLLFTPKRRRRPGPRSFPRADRSDRRDEAQEPALRLSENHRAACPRLRYRD